MTNFVWDWHMIETFHNLLCYKNKTNFLELMFLEVFADEKNLLKYAGTNIILLFINIKFIIIIIIIILFFLVKWGVSDFKREAVKQFKCGSLFTTFMVDSCARIIILDMNFCKTLVVVVHRGSSSFNTCLLNN